MKIEKQKPIDVIANRPKVVLIGNGLLLSSYAKGTANKGKNKMWIEHIFDIAERVLTDEDEEKYKDVPYSILATAITPIEDTKRRKNYAKSFDTIVLKEKSLLERLLSLPFDVILTTNYTYEIENIFKPNFSQLVDKSEYAVKTKVIKSESDNGDKDETKSTIKRDIRLLYTYNNVKENLPIWHLHGECRNKSSLVLTHDEYSKLICDIINHNKQRANAYEKYINNLIFESWVDYLIMGDVYVIGQGLSFSEFDLWWILNRKAREVADSGKLYFFTPKNESQLEQEMLTLLNHDKGNKFIVKHLDVEINNETREKDYEAFYDKAIIEIEKILNK